MNGLASFKRWLPLGLALVALASLAAGCQGAAPASAANVPAIQNSITVSGTGEAHGAPDIAFVMLGVSAVNADVGEAVAESSRVMQAITAALTAQGIDAKDIQTINFSVWPEDRYDPRTGEVTVGERRYHVDSTVQAKVRDISKVSEVIDAGLNAGANSVGGLNFGIDDVAALEAEARTNAIANARQRAQELADALGMELGEPIVVSEGFSNVPLPPIIYDRAEAAQGGGAPPISPGQQTVMVQVTVTFATK